MKRYFTSLFSLECLSLFVLLTLIVGCGTQPKDKTAGSLSQKGDSAASSGAQAQADTMLGSDPAARRIAPDQGISQNGDPEARAYFEAFRKARTRPLASGQSPFGDMEPQKEMVLAGEKLMTAFPNSSFYEAIKIDFRQALRNFVGIYQLEEGGYVLERVGDPMEIGDYWNTETETHKLFVQEQSDSRYKEIVARLLARKSRISKRPENIYVIYAETAASMEEAEEKQFEWLNRGEDVLHILPYDAGTAEESFVLTYRFFEDEEQSLTYLDEVQKRTGGKAGYMMMSVNGEKLYQLGI